jgi:hypothetical protein
MQEARRPSNPANMITAMAGIGALFHTASGSAFADLMIDGHRETWPIRSKRFRTWLRRCHYEQTRSALSGPMINSALDLLEAQAQFDAPERSVHVRVAEHAGHTYLDLVDEDWRAVEIGPDGWRVIESPPVRFRRPAGILPLPVPEPGGSIEAPRSASQPPQPKRYRAGRDVAIGDAAAARALPGVGHIG